MPNITRAAIANAAERARLLPRDHRVMMALLARATASGLIPDRYQPRNVSAIASAAHFGQENVRLALRHLQKHGWVTATKGKLAGGRFVRYTVAIGLDCDCPDRGRSLSRKAMSDVERARRSRLRREGVEVDPAATVGPPEERTAVYRFFDAAGDLLYVGITNDVIHRWRKHAAEKTWWAEVQKQTVEWHASRKEAERAEGIAITWEYPRYNIAGAPRVASPTPLSAAPTWHELTKHLWND